MSAGDPRPTVSLVLGSGGARGLAHIGVIEALEARGYRIRSISGSSMGALVGGIHAAGKLPLYRGWATALERLDVLRLVDWTLGGSGFIKGDRVIGALRDLIGDTDIERLPVAFTAVATDLDRQSEVWLSHGPLFDAIRASIAIPGLLTPHAVAGRSLVDGGLLNPLPIAPTLRDLTDLTIAVNVNGPEEPLSAPAPPRPEPAAGNGLRADYARKVAEFLEGIVPKSPPKPVEPGWRELLARSLETMQSAITRLKLATHQPDLMISIPRNACLFYEFWRAEELIAIGQARAAQALDIFEAGAGPRRSRPPPAG